MGIGGLLVVVWFVSLLLGSEVDCVGLVLLFVFDRCSILWVDSVGLFTLGCLWFVMLGVE